MSEDTKIHESSHPSMADDANNAPRYVRLMAVGAGATIMGSLVWSAGILAERSSWVDNLTVPGAAVTFSGIGAMAIGSVLHHRQDEAK